MAESLLPLLLIAVLALASFARPAVSEAIAETQVAKVTIVSISHVAEGLDIPSEEKCCAKVEGHQSGNHSRCLTDLTILAMPMDFGICKTQSIVWQDEHSDRVEQWRSALLRPPIHA